MVQPFHLGNRLVRHVAAQLAHMQGKALGIAWILCQPIEMLYVHATAPRTFDAPTLELQVNSPARHSEITRSTSAFVMALTATVATAGTHSRFFRRIRVMIRAWRSPKMPLSVPLVTKPGIENSSRTVRGDFMDYPSM
jgi:hypothetical protein